MNNVLGSKDNPFTRNILCPEEIQYKWCQCTSCRYKAIATPEDDFYYLTRKAPLLCTKCFEREVGMELKGQDHFTDDSLDSAESN